MKTKKCFILIMIILFLFVINSACKDGPAKGLSKDEQIVFWEKRGNELEKAGKYKEAIETYTKAIELAPRNFPVAYLYNRRAEAYEKIGDYYKAIGDYTKLINKEYTYEDKYYDRGKAYFKLAMHYMEEKYEDKAETCLRMALNDLNEALEICAHEKETCNMSLPYIFFYLGMTNIKLGYFEPDHYRQAIRDFNSVPKEPSLFVSKDLLAVTNYYRGICGIKLCDMYYEIDVSKRKDVEDVEMAKNTKKSCYESHYNILKETARLGNKGSQDFLRQQGIDW